MLIPSDELGKRAWNVYSLKCLNINVDVSQWEHIDDSIHGAGKSPGYKL